VTTVYVGDENRIQTFNTSGVYQGEVVLPGAGQTRALAVDTNGDVYVKSAELAGVQEYDPSGGMIHEFDPTSPAGALAGEQVRAITIASAGEVVISDEHLASQQGKNQGVLYDIVAGQVRQLPEWGQGEEFSGQGIAYDDTNERLYVTEGNAFGDVEIFRRVIFPTAVTTTSPSPVPTEVKNVRTATVKGEVDPEGLDESGFFEYGACATPLSCATSPYEATHVPATAEGTSKEDLGSGIAFVNVEGMLGSLQPNRTYHYRLVGHNVNGNTLGQEGTFATKAIKPTIEHYQALFVTANSVELSGIVNPENDSTSYHFEYGPCVSVEACGSSSYPDTTTVSAAGAGFGGTGVYAEVHGLEPKTKYHYRLLATDGVGPVESPEDTFTTRTEPALEERIPGPPLAVTGAAGSVGTEIVVLSGTVNSNGAATSLLFKLGVYEGEKTQYGIVGSGDAGSGFEAVPESEQISNLRPGVTYAFRILATNGLGKDEGAPVLFTTTSVPPILTEPLTPSLLTIPPIRFPVVVKKLTPAQELTHALKACERKPKSKRAACKRAARKKYPVGKKA
jgi:hypothetical protein